MDKLFTHIDIYCERTNNQFWAEPVNACTNIFFVMVGVYLLITLKKMQATSKWLKFLAINCIVVGLGSFLFHTFANFLTMWADILPIMLLICSTFLYIIRYIFDISWRVSMLIITLFFTVGVLLQVAVPPVLNGSHVYSHAVLGLLLVAFFSRSTYPQLSHYFIGATVFFLISLTFRTIDSVICEQFPLGTHFLWHIMNSITLGLALKGIFTTLPQKNKFNFS